ncbi:hypothetical protein [Phenylobacterium sp.]|uniref:hypothetical protein n=1 Tax=Phenylobacterium sp. TaxID=1871053 RepID=UPI00272EF2C0|nr:hypothetical protein [Phenylobacterium sp.]MDP1873185.1 hypothetical protein [Phenylobacterium sp.]
MGVLVLIIYWPVVGFFAYVSYKVLEGVPPVIPGWQGISMLVAGTIGLIMSLPAEAQVRRLLNRMIDERIKEREREARDRAEAATDP